jgi:hypothetical protein
MASVCPLIELLGLLIVSGPSRGAAGGGAITAAPRAEEQRHTRGLPTH